MKVKIRRADSSPVKDELLAEERRRRAQRDAYVEQARREQQEAGRRAREAYRRSQGKPGNAASGDAHAPAGGAAANDPAQNNDPRRRTAAQGEPIRYYEGRRVPDYYDVLEVSPRARQSVIDKAYRTLMRECHPDQGGDPRKAQLINEAYEILRDPAKRRRYDAENGIA